MLSVGVYDGISNFNGEKAALDIMELLNVDRGYYMTKSCRSVNMHRKRSSIYRVSEPQKKESEGAVSLNEKQQDKNIETEETSYDKGCF